MSYIYVILLFLIKEKVGLYSRGQIRMPLGAWILLRFTDLNANW